MIVAMAGMKSRPSRNANPLQSRRGPFKPESSIIFDPEVESLEPDRFGRFSLCIRNSGNAANMSDEVLINEFHEAGDITEVHRTEKLIFIRFDSKEELQNCIRMFGAQYSFRIGKQASKMELLSNGSDRPGYQSDQPQMRSQNKPARRPMNHSEGPGGDADRHRGQERFHSQQKGNISRQSGNNHDIEDEEESSTELFISNIESKEDFEREIQKYRPKNMNVVMNGVKKYAFVSMWNQEDAKAAIQDLDTMMQQTRRLSVAFNKKRQHSQSEHSSSMSDCNTEVGVSPKSDRNHNKWAKNKTMAPREVVREESRSMPKLESCVDVSSMPPLVPHGEVLDPNGIYDVDTRVLVTNFPPHTKESELRAVFKGYRVIDICVLSNDYTNDCTSALLYLSTIYEAVRAVTDERGFVMDGFRLKVIPPSNNIILKKILVRMETGLRDWN